MCTRNYTDVCCTLLDDFEHAMKSVEMRSTGLLEEARVPTHQVPTQPPARRDVVKIADHERHHDCRGILGRAISGAWLEDA